MPPHGVDTSALEEAPEGWRGEAAGQGRGVRDKERMNRK